MSNAENSVDYTQLHYFVAEGELLHPQPVATSLWNAKQMHGVAVSGALGREAERAIRASGRTDLIPARYTVDLFQPALMAPCALSSKIVREGRRLALVDTVLQQEGDVVARCSTLFLKHTESAPGEVWSPADRPRPPSVSEVPVMDDPNFPWIKSDGEWTQDLSTHQNAERKFAWLRPVDVVKGEPLTPFQSVTSAADSASMVTNWGTGGVEHINSDINLALTRMPRSTEIGVFAVDRLETDGIAVGTASILDRDGVIGTATVTSLANARRAVDMSGLTAGEDLPATNA